MDKKIQIVINTLKSTFLRVDQLDAVCRLSACVDKLEEVMEELRHDGSSNEQRE